MKINIWTEIIASLAGMLTIIAYIPQTYKVYITNKTDDLDIATFILLLIIKMLWLIWGILLKSYIIILFAILQFFIVGYIVNKIYINNNLNKYKHYNSKYHYYNKNNYYNYNNLHKKNDYLF